MRSSGSARVASSGLPDDKLALETTFTEGDHRRRRRPREWLVDGLHKIERVRFLGENGAKRTMAQAALRFILDSGATTVIPTITSEAELLEHVGAADVPELSGEELDRISELYERNEPVGA